MRFKASIFFLALVLLTVLFCHKRKSVTEPEDSVPTAFFTVTPDTGELDLRPVADGDRGHSIGDQVQIRFSDHDTLLFDADSERLIPDVRVAIPT